MAPRIALVFALLLTACMPTRTPAQVDARQDCLAAVEAHADERAADECPDEWDTCSARPAIMAELSAAQKDCR